MAVSAPWGAEVWSSAQPSHCMEGDMNGSEPITAEHIVAAVLAHALIGRLGREPDATIAGCGGIPCFTGGSAARCARQRR